MWAWVRAGDGEVLRDGMTVGTAGHVLKVMSIKASRQPQSKRVGISGMNEEGSDVERMDTSQARKPEIRVSINVCGHIRSPQEITELLGLVPTRTTVQGEPIPVPRTILKYKRNCWILEGSSDPSCPFENQVDALLDRVTLLADKFSELPDDLTVAVHCVVYDYERATALILSRTAIRSAARIGAGIDIDYIDLTPHED